MPLASPVQAPISINLCRNQKTCATGSASANIGHLEFLLNNADLYQNCASLTSVEETEKLHPSVKSKWYEHKKR